MRLADVAGRRSLGIGLHCRACGRHVAITPLGIRRLIASGRRWTVDQLVARARCGTCSSAEIYASGESFEAELPLPAVLVRAWSGGPRHDGRGALSIQGGIINPCPWL